LGGDFAEILGTATLGAGVHVVAHFPGAQLRGEGAGDDLIDRGSRLRESARSRVPEGGRARPGDSCQQQFRRFRLGIEPENFFTFGFQQELNGPGEIAKTFFPGFALSIRTGNFETGRPKTAFARLAVMKDGREFFHAYLFSPELNCTNVFKLYHDRKFQSVEGPLL
jgi:hypothetical protein